MAYHKITPNIVHRTIVKHLTPREEFPTACVYKDDDYFVRMHKALIKVNGKNCGIQYQFEVNVNHEHLDYDWYFESSEEKDE